jgi:hypothetical protein
MGLTPYCILKTEKILESTMRPEPAVEVMHLKRPLVEAIPVPKSSVSRSPPAPEADMHA